MTEAEYVALSRVVCTIKFIAETPQSIELTVQLPITVYIDNMGAIFVGKQAKYE